MESSISHPRCAVILALVCLTALFYSCSSSEEDNLACPACDVIERTDIILEGDLELHNFMQSIEADHSMNLVDFHHFGTPSADIEYIVRLVNGYNLIIKVHDEANMNPWRQVNTPYNIYPAGDLDDKLQFATVELRTSANEPLYATNLNEISPPGITLDAFRLTHYDGSMLRGRIRDMVLYHYNDSGKEIRINGTFVGAVTFE